MVTELVNINDVREARYNPREISEGAFEGLKTSIKQFGVVRPLVINRTSGILVGGHQTLKACKELGLEQVPVVYVELDEVKEKALNVTLNNQSISGYFTDGLQDLLTEINSMLPESFDMLKLDQLVVPTDWDDSGLKDAGEIGDYDEQSDVFDVKIENVNPNDREEVVRKCNDALAGTGYVAKAY